MRASVVLLFAFLALTFVAAYAAVEEETNDPSLLVKADNDEAFVVGDRVKRALAPTWKDCNCVSWGSAFCRYTKRGCECHRKDAKTGGCEVNVWSNGIIKNCNSHGPEGAECLCNDQYKYVMCYQMSNGNGIIF